MQRHHNSLAFETAESQKKNRNRENDTMTEQVQQTNEGEMFTMGMAFMGFLMGVSAICGILFLSELFQMMSKMMG